MAWDKIEAFIRKSQRGYATLPVGIRQKIEAVVQELRDAGRRPTGIEMWLELEPRLSADEKAEFASEALNTVAQQIWVEGMAEADDEAQAGNFYPDQLVLLSFDRGGQLILRGNLDAKTARQRLAFIADDVNSNREKERRWLDDLIAEREAT